MSHPTVVEFFVGDSLVVEFTSTWKDTGLPVDLTGARILSTCRNMKAGGVQMWEKRNAANGGGDDQVLVAADPTTGVSTVFATAAESLAMFPGQYDLDVVAILSTGKTATIGYATLKMIARPTAHDVEA